MPLIGLAKPEKLRHCAFLRPTRGEDHDLASRRMLKQVDRLCRKHQLVRQPSETLNQFADRIEAFCNAEDTVFGAQASTRLQALPVWYRQFASARYQGKRPAALDWAIRPQQSDECIVGR